MKRILFLTILLAGLYIKAQTIPLSEYFGTTIMSGMYFKDTDNVLPLFKGKWTANYNDNTITLVLKNLRNILLNPRGFQI